MLKTTIGIVNYNRSRLQWKDKQLLLLPNCIESLVKTVENTPINNWEANYTFKITPPQSQINKAGFPAGSVEISKILAKQKDIDLIVVDFNSTDWPLEEWLPGKWPYNYKIIKEDGPFSVGKGRNLILNSFQGDVLILLDADMLVPIDFIAKMAELASQGLAVFPLDYRYSNPEQTKTTVSIGYGNWIINTKIVEKLLQIFKGKPYPEYQTWGGEDVQMFNHIKDRRLAPIWRQVVEAFYHQWHPKDGSIIRKMLI